MFIGLKCSVRAELLAATWKVKFRFRSRGPEMQFSASASFALALGVTGKLFHVL